MSHKEMTLPYHAWLCKFITVSPVFPMSLTRVDSVELDSRLGLEVPGLFLCGVLFAPQDGSLLSNILLLALLRAKKSVAISFLGSTSRSADRV